MLTQRTVFHFFVTPLQSFLCLPRKICLVFITSDLMNGTAMRPAAVLIFLVCGSYCGVLIWQQRFNASQFTGKWQWQPTSYASATSPHAGATWLPDGRPFRLQYTSTNLAPVPSLEDFSVRSQTNNQTIASYVALTR